MKKILFLLSLALVVNVSCSKFLEQSAQDLVRPQNIEHYKELLRGEGYYKEIYPRGWFVDVMTDNVNLMDLVYPVNGANAIDLQSKNPYKWASDLENESGTFTDQFFRYVYRNILAANSCLEGMDEVAEGTAQERHSLKGQAHFIRAYGYFTLANLYAQAYNVANPQDLCVPVVTRSTPTLNGIPQATQKEVWDLISSDIEIAVEELSKIPETNNIYEISYKAALLLASRIYLFKEDFGKSIYYAEKLLDIQPALRNISNYTGVPNTTGASRGERAFLSYQANPEVLFTFGTIYNTAPTTGMLFYAEQVTFRSKVNYTISKGVPGALYDIYTANDKRRSTWFSATSGTLGVPLSKPYHSLMKFNTADGCRSTHYMRTAEAYLNLSEAYARQATPDIAKSLEYLNTLRKNRINGYVDMTSANFSTPEALVDFIIEERRREFCFEEFHRWWDLRRMGQPELKHKYMAETYVLRKNDPAYVLNFPKQELENNTMLKQNPRPERLPE